MDQEQVKKKTPKKRKYPQENNLEQESEQEGVSIVFYVC
jgi:hypothetical protein